MAHTIYSLHFKMRVLHFEVSRCTRLFVESLYGNMKILSLDFYDRDTCMVAKALLGLLRFYIKGNAFVSKK